MIRYEIKKIFSKSLSKVSLVVLWYWDVLDRKVEMS